jgi:ABC-type glutathione transport system ATPase component
MLLIEHDMGLVLGICDRLVVLEFGRSSPRARRRSCARTPGSSPPTSATTPTPRKAFSEDQNLSILISNGP